MRSTYRLWFKYEFPHHRYHHLWLAQQRRRATTQKKMYYDFFLSFGVGLRQRHIFYGDETEICCAVALHLRSVLCISVAPLGNCHSFHPAAFSEIIWTFSHRCAYYLSVSATTFCAGLYWYCLMSLRFLTTNYYWAWLTVQVILDAAQRWNCWLFTILTNFFTGIYLLLFRNTYCASWLFKAK